MSEANPRLPAKGQRIASRSLAVSVVSTARLTGEALAAFLTTSIRIQVAQTVQSLGDVTAHADSHVVIVDAPSFRIDEIPRGVVQFCLLIYGLENRDHARLIGWAAAGATVFVSRDATADELLMGVHAAAQGEVLCERTIAGLVLSQASKPGSRTRGAGLERLTARERQILSLIDQGLSNKEIAVRLSIGLSTVKNHVHSILNRLGVSARREAASVAGPIAPIEYQPLGSTLGGE